MKNVHQIIFLLSLASNLTPLDISAAGKRKAEQEPGNNIRCSKKSVRGTEQEKLDWVLFNAARTGNADIVTKLLTMNANPNMLINGCTALHIAARNANSNCIKALLTSGKVDINTRADHFMTPLHEAVRVFDRNSGIACIELILQEGAKINAQDDTKNTPLHLAAIYGHHHYVGVLLAWGADHTLRNAKGKTPLMIAEEKGFSAIIGLLNKKDNAEDMDIS